MINITPITVAYGDGSGPELLEACLNILQEAGAPITVESISAGERIYRQGARDGMLPGDLPQLKRTGLLLLGPIIMPDHKKCQPLMDSLTEQMNLTQSMPYPQLYPRLLDIAHYGYHTGGEQLNIFTSTMSADAPKKLKAAEKIMPMLEACLLLLHFINAQNTIEKINRSWQTLDEEQKKTKHLDELVEALISHL